jgi:uncharacterized membrane protein YpjA
MGLHGLLQGQLYRFFTETRVIHCRLVTDRYVIIIKLLDYIFNILPVYARRWELEAHLHRNVAHTRFDTR